MLNQALDHINYLKKRIDYYFSLENVFSFLLLLQSKAVDSDETLSYSDYSLLLLLLK